MPFVIISKNVTAGASTRSRTLRRQEQAKNAKSLLQKLTEKSTRGKVYHKTQEAEGHKGLAKKQLKEMVKSNNYNPD